MTDERTKQIRELAIHQLSSLIELTESEVKGTSLELDLKMAVKTLQGSSAVLSASALSPIVKVEETIDEDEETEDYWNEDEDEDWDEDEEEALVVPNGFDNEESYSEFLRAQTEVLPSVVDEETGETYDMRPDDVVGVVATENGFVEVGDLEGSFDKVEEILNDQNAIYDEDEDEVLYQNEVEEVPSIRVSFSRQDNNALTEHHVSNVILRHPSSRTMLNTFGEDYRVVDGGDASEKIVLFRIDNTNDLSRKASQGVMFSNGVVQFAGHLTMPGIGGVFAKALVD